MNMGQPVTERKPWEGEISKNGPPGPPGKEGKEGKEGPKGLAGSSEGFVQKYLAGEVSEITVESFAFNNADPKLATELYMSKIPVGEPESELTQIFLLWLLNGSPGFNGVLYIHDSPTTWLAFKVTAGEPEFEEGARLLIEFTGGNGTLENGKEYSIQFSSTGSKGSKGEAGEVTAAELTEAINNLKGEIPKVYTWRISENAEILDGPEGIIKAIEYNGADYIVELEEPLSMTCQVEPTEYGVLLAKFVQQNRDGSEENPFQIGFRVEEAANKREFSLTLIERK